MLQSVVILHHGESITIKRETSFGTSCIYLEVNNSGYQMMSPPLEYIREDYPELDEKGVFHYALDHCVKGLLEFPYITKEHSYETVQQEVEDYKEITHV